MGANGFEFAQRQPAHQADLVPEFTQAVGFGLDVTENVRALIIAARELEKLLQIHAINDRGVHIPFWKNQESREQPVDGFFDFSTNPFGFILIEDRPFRVALAKKASVGQPGIILLNGQAADEAFLSQHRAIVADLLFLVRDLVGVSENRAAQWPATNRALIWVSQPGQCADKKEDQSSGKTPRDRLDIGE